MANLLTRPAGGREDPIPDPAEVLAVVLDGSPFGFLLRDVLEVLPAAAAVPVPGAPAVVEGLLDVRGRLVPLLDLRRRLGLGERAMHPDDHLILCVAAGEPVAVRVDRAEWVVRLTGGIEVLEPAPPHLQGVARTPDGALLVYDVGACFSDQEAAQLAGAVQTFAGQA